MKKQKMQAKPFIKIFSVDNRHFVYDVNANKFLGVDGIVCDILMPERSGNGSDEPLLKKYSAAQIDKTRENIRLARQKGLFSLNRPKMTYFKSKSFLERLRNTLNNGISNIILEVTQDCNMRCKYCAYSDHYRTFRSHGRQYMTTEIMKRAVDYYLAHSNDIAKKNISFYGGEPLLNFNLIKECVKYAKQKYSGQFTFNMTINATLLNPERVAFLAQHKFFLLVSLDGPEELHDRYRVFKNNTGTFATTIKNLKHIFDHYPGYYRDYVSFNCVTAPPYAFDRLNEFFQSNELTAGANEKRFAGVSGKSTSFFDTYADRPSNGKDNPFAQLLDSYIAKLASGDIPGEVENAMFRERYLHIHRRNYDTLQETCPPYGQCTLGEKGLFVRSGGTVNFCTQVDGAFDLGNVFDGLNLEKIEKIYRRLDDLYETHCFGCWAIRLCLRKCLNYVTENGEIDENAFLKTCEQNKKDIGGRIKEYLGIRKQNPQALDFLDQLEIS